MMFSANYCVHICSSKAVAVTSRKIFDSCINAMDKNSSSEL